MYDEGYDTDGDIGPFYNSVEHEEDLAPNIEEETLPSKEELEALMPQAENPINNNINSKMVKELQDELQKFGCIKRGR
eukprot:3280547-Ditylum_brightwellii.AAC.1